MQTTLIPLPELDLTTLPSGTECAGVVGDVTLYRVAWLLATRDGATYYIGDHSATRGIERLTEIEDATARHQQQLAALEAERDRLLTTLLPAPTAPAPAKPKRGHKPYARPEPGPLVVCGIDGCAVEKEEGRSLNMHRLRVHPDWTGTPETAPEEVAAPETPFTHQRPAQPS